MGLTSSTTRDLLYAVPIDTPNRKPNETPVFRHPAAVGKNLSQLSNLQTVHDSYRLRLRDHPEDRCFGRRERGADGQLSKAVTWYTNRSILAEAEAFGAGLMNLGLATELSEWKDMRLRFAGIYSKNSLDYFKFDIGCCIQNVTVVPIYDTLGEEATLFAFNQTKMSVCALTANHADGILKQRTEHNRFAYLQHLVVFDPENLPEHLKDQKEVSGIKIWTFEEVKENGKSKPRPWAAVTGESVYAFSYTSGTTGEPKGAMISHKNVVNSFVGAAHCIDIGPSDVHISYLPLAHVMERMAYNLMMFSGGKIGIFSGDILQLKEDLAIIRPTIFSSVPRLYNRFHDAIKTGIKGKSDFTQSAVNFALRAKLDNLNSDCEYTHAVYDKLLFNKMKAVLGGRVRVMMSGSAPISADVINFLKVAFCCPIMEGYGQTEASGLEFATAINDPISGHVGGPTLHNEFKLVDVPEMNYTCNDVDENGQPMPRGEIWVRGPNVIKGYYKMDEKNQETFTDDGWMISGDIAAIVGKERRLKIIDRKKNIFKLQQGEYIAPEKLENAYRLVSPHISSVYVHGDSMQSCLVGVVNVEAANIAHLARELGLPKDSEPEKLQRCADFNRKLLEMFEEQAKASKFNPLEKLKAVYVETRTLGELKLITEAFKLKRHEAKAFYKEVCDNMYRGLGQ